MVLLTARLTIACYLLRYPLVAADRFRAALWVWTVGCLLLGVHIVCAFHLKHRWSHDAAVIETARQTRDLFGLDWGGGVWVNYACLLLWAADVARHWRRGPESMSRRDCWFWILHSFLAMIVFSATVVFASAWWWLPILLTILLTWSLSSRTHS